MTIAAAYLVSEGIIFGADSTSTVLIHTPEGTGVAQVLSHSQKVFEVGENSRLGICTWGDGSIGNISHRTIVARLSDEIKDDTSVKESAELLCNIVKDILKDNKVNFVGYYLGGWDPKSHEPSCFMIQIKDGDINTSDMQMGLCSFSGMPNFFTRVFRGYDLELPEKLSDEIKKLIPNDNNILEDFDNIFKEAFEKATAPLIAAGYRDLPIREAIDFVYSYLHISVKAIKFRFGAPACGGPIEIGFVSTDRRFRWVRHKVFSTAIMEQEGGYYV